MTPEMNDVRERMQEVARAVQVILPPYTGFAVFAFDFGEHGKRIEYVSNAERESMLLALREFIAKDTQKTHNKHVSDAQHEQRETRLAEAIEKHLPTLKDMAAWADETISRMVADFEKALE